MVYFSDVLLLLDVIVEPVVMTTARLSDRSLDEGLGSSIAAPRGSLRSSLSHRVESNDTDRSVDMIEGSDADRVADVIEGVDMLEGSDADRVADVIEGVDMLEGSDADRVADVVEEGADADVTVDIATVDIATAADAVEIPHTDAVPSTEGVLCLLSILNEVTERHFAGLG